MAEFDHGTKMIAEKAGRQLARLAGVESRHWQPAESTVQVSVEKLADRVFLAGRGKHRFIVYFEFCTNWNTSVLWSMLAKSGLLSEREKLPTVCIAVVLRQQGFRSRDGQMRLEAAGGPTQHLWFKEVCLWKLEPEPWWEAEPGLMALYPLCQHGRQPREAITYAAQAIERALPTPAERHDALALLSIFGELAYPRLDVEHLIGSEKMKESKMLQRIRKESDLLAKRAAILQVLRARFGADSATEFTATLDEVEEPERLVPLLDLAVTCDSVDEFRAGLPVHASGQ